MKMFIHQYFCVGLQGINFGFDFSDFARNCFVRVLYMSKCVDRKLLSHHGGCQEVSRCRTRGESEQCTARMRRSTQDIHF